MRALLTAFLFAGLIGPAVAEQWKNSPPPAAHPTASPRSAVQHSSAPRVAPKVQPRFVSTPQPGSTSPAIAHRPSVGSTFVRPTTAATSMRSPAQFRRHHVERTIARRIVIGGAVLALPAVAFYGVPVAIDVPDVGYVEIPEADYALLYARIISERMEIEILLAELRRYLTTRPAPTQDEAESVTNRRIIMAPPRDAELEPDGPDYSEPITFDAPAQKTKSQRLY